MLELRDVTVQFADTLALDGLTLELGSGEAAIVRGPSGCGKTTLLRVIAGLTAPDKGEVWMHGRQVSGPDIILPPYQRQIAYVFQEPRLWPHMTVKQNIMFGLAAMGADQAREHLMQVSSSTGVEGLLERYPSELSGGQARRVSLARALAPMRQLVLMDEPLTNLDDEGRRDLLGVIEQAWQRERFSLLYVTHDALDEIPFASRIIELDKGRLLK